MQRIPKINITRIDSTRSSVCDPNDFANPSGALTDCEFIESSPKPSKAKEKAIERDVFLTDVEFSSEDDEDEIDYPKDCIISMFDIGMNSEETLNSHSPNKSQRSVTCSLERFQRREMVEKYEDGGTDQEGIYMSDEDIEVPKETDISLFSDGNAYVSMRDKLASPSRPSPCVTPDPRQIKIQKTSKDLRVEAQSNALTDTEILSDIENKNRYRRFMNFNKWRDSGESDSDSSSGRERYNFRKMNPSRSCDSLKSKNKQVLALTPTELTDVEYLENENVVFRKKGPVYESRPTVIQRNKNAERPKQKKKELKKVHKNNLLVSQPSQGYATDVEAFESDEDHIEDTKAVDYIPGSKRELVLSNENNKGGVSLIMPIDPKYMLRCEEYDCGYSDVEDLPGFELEEQRYPTPDLPRPERFVVQNSENMIDKSHLMCVQEQEPGTDIEDVTQKKDYLSLKEWLTESTTDVEDFHSGHVSDADEFSCDEDDTRMTRSPELITSDTYVTSRDIFQNVPKILRISPSPVFIDDMESGRNESVIRKGQNFLTANETAGDPLTDVEELDVQPRPKLCQKRKNVDTGSIKICFGNRSSRGIRTQGKESDKKQNQQKKQ